MKIMKKNSTFSLQCHTKLFFTLIITLLSQIKTQRFLDPFFLKNITRISQSEEGDTKVKKIIKKISLQRF